MPLKRSALYATGTIWQPEAHSLVHSACSLRRCFLWNSSSTPLFAWTLDALVWIATKIAGAG